MKHTSIMKDKILHIRIPEDILKRFKILCIEMDLSAPVQTTAIITQFVAIHEENKKILEEAKNKEKK